MFSEQNGQESDQLSYKVGVKVFTVANETLDKGWTSEHLEDFSLRS
jgi:hypothetical protein